MRTSPRPSRARTTAAARRSATRSSRRRRICTSSFARALKPGSGIGYHEQKEDEIYYVLSGRGVMTLDGKDVEVGPGTAVLTRTGSSHGLKQVGAEDLVILINYPQ
jgi:mannose-6-phosphate isomerase-like protein (cupin superfamily)